MQHINRVILTLLLIGAIAAPSYSACTPTLASVDDISVSLMTASGDEIHRREFAEISDDLASALGISAGDIDADDEAPNPQIRLRMQSSPASSGIESNNAVFTVVAIRNTTDTTNRLWVYESQTGTDKDSGEFKLFALSNGSILSTSDSNADDILDDIVLRAFGVPVSSSAVTDSSASTTTTTFYCEPSSSKSYLEKVTDEGDDQVVVLAPHGGNIETETSEQAYAFAAELENLNLVPVNVWNLEGKWGNNQTFERWHITATSLDSASYPGLNDLLPADGDFDYAVAFHGFGGSSSTQTCTNNPSAPKSLTYQIILGGGATRNLKCAMAQAIDDALVTASRTDAIGISIRDDVGNIEIPDSCGRYVTQSGLSGTHADNIVNRVAENGGIQLEQSKTLRSDATLPNLVAEAVAAGLADFMADNTTNYCSGL